jgi:hypothetical protein
MPEAYAQEKASFVSRRGAGFPNSAKALIQLSYSLVFHEGVDNGRPMGTPEFIAPVEHALGRAVTPGKRGRKRESGEKLGRVDEFDQA